MAKVKGLEDVVKVPIIAAAWVEPADAVAQRVKSSLSKAVVTGGESFAGGIPDGQTALVATEHELVFVSLRPGLVSLKADRVVGTIAREELTGFGFTKGSINQKIQITTRSGDEYTYNLHRLRRASILPVMAAMGFPSD